MRSFIKEYKLYSFDELSEDVKKKLIKREREIQAMDYCEAWLYDDLVVRANDLIQDYMGVKQDCIKVYYDLSYSQGSGAMIEFDIHIKDLNNKYKVFSNEEIDFLVEKNVVDWVRVRHNGSNYYHEYTFCVESDYYNYWNYDEIKEYYDIPEDKFNTIEERFYKLIDSCNRDNASEFIKDIIDMNGDLKHYGYEQIEYYSDCDEEIIKEIIVNGDNEYFENGVIYCGQEIM